MVRNVLGHMVPGQKKDIGEVEEFVIVKTDFLLAVCRGFAGNLPADLRHTFVREVCKWAGESLPDSNNPLNLQLSNGQLVRYEDGIGGTNVTFGAVKRFFVLPPLVQTGCVPQNLDLFKTWPAVQQPIIMSGPMRKESLDQALTLNVTVLHYNARTSSKDVLQKLRQFWSINTGTSGRIYRPNKGRRLIFYMKISILHHPIVPVAIHNGFYDDDLEFQCAMCQASGHPMSEAPVGTTQGGVDRVSRSRCCSASDSFRVFRPPGTKPHAYCVVHGCKPPTFPHFLRREPSSLQLLQRHVAGQVE